MRTFRDLTGEELRYVDRDILAERLAALQVERAHLLTTIEQANAGWLIWSRYHNAWWKAQERGYTTDMMGAGRYDREHADRIAGVRKCDDGTPGEVVVRAPEISLIGTSNLMAKMRGRIAAATRAAALDPIPAELAEVDRG